MSIIQLKSKPKKKKIGIIIQARMGSQRFPGKSMALLLGKPVIQWTVERALHIHGPKKYDTPWVVLAVPDQRESEPMLELADSLQVGNFCGEELNVLKRYYDASRCFRFDIIMRLTGDCPFVDPRVCSEVLQLLIWRNLDYASNVFPRRTYPRGLDCEVFTFDCLEAAYIMSDNLYQQEHVTPWMQTTEGIIRGNVMQQEDKSELNWCVDYALDIPRLEQEVNNSKIKLLLADGGEK